MHRTIRFFLFQVALLACSVSASAKSPKATTDESGNCYAASDKRDLRLWNGAAPGAAGDEPCRDIPYLRVFPAAHPNGKANAAILVIPGGGYDHLTNAKEQTPVGDYFSQNLNLTTFVLTYRLVQSDGTYRYPVPMWDGQRALKWIKAHAGDYGIDSTKIGLFGFSAGGHLATTLAEHSASDFDLPAHDAVDAASGKAAFLGLGYPVISMDPEQSGDSNSRKHLLTGYKGRELAHLNTYLSGQDNVKAGTPPVFLFVSMDDARISPQNSVLLVQALKSANMAVEDHLFPHGAHGVGLAQDVPDEAGWPEMFHQWLTRQGMLP